MNQQSYIPGYSKMITETLYKPQEDYLFVNNLKIKEFTYDPKFKRELTGPFIKEYCEHYEADKPQPNALYSPLHIPSEDINRQCNPLVAYPFGVPHKYKKEKCPKCKGNASYGKKKRTRKNKKNENNDLFTSSLKKEDRKSVICCSNGLHNMNKNEPFSNCVINSYVQGNFKTASFKSADASETNSIEKNKLYSTIYKENFDEHLMRIYSDQFHECDASNDFNKRLSYENKEYLLSNESYSKNSLSCFTDANKGLHTKYSLLINHPKLYTMSNPTSERIIVSNELNNSLVPRNSLQEKSSTIGKGKLYLKLNDTSINEYSNILSSEGISENHGSNYISEKVKTSDDKTNKGRKKVKISVNRKIEKEKKEDSTNTNENNEIKTNVIDMPKKKYLKSKINEVDIEKNANKQKSHAIVLSDLSIVPEQDIKKNKEPSKKYKNKKTTPIRKISHTPSTSARKASGETYLRMCKMQMAIDAQIKNKEMSLNSNKGLLTSEEELFGSNSSRNTYIKSRVIYLKEKKKEPNRKLSKEGINNINTNLLVSPRIRPILNTNINSFPNNNLNIKTNINKNINKSSNGNAIPESKINTEANINTNMTQALKKKKIIKPNENIVKSLSKGNNEIKLKKEDILISPKKVINTNKNNRIVNKNIYQKKIPLTRKLSTKSSNPPTDRKTFYKNSLVLERKNEIKPPKKIIKKIDSSTIKNINISINRVSTNNNGNEILKYKNGLLKKKISETIKNTQENKKSGINNNKDINDLQIKKLITIPLKKKKILVETQKIMGNKNISSQIKNENSENLGSISDSALMNENEKSPSKVGVKFGRSETKLYMPNHKIVPFKTTEVKMNTKKDSGRLKTKTITKVSASDISMQKKMKEQNKIKKPSNIRNIQPTFINKNTIKGNLKSKKKELYDNILLLTKGISKKNEVEGKINNTGRIIKSSENKNFENDSDLDSEILNNKVKRSQTTKDKKKELIKKDKKEPNKNIKKKDKVVEKKEKKVENKE